ncbi:hypothetical protein [Rhizosphaericola mali]|uniref:Uncharacterized protein n=1 Tax=Rhizosphaericola mali TaxID=2545455 RepID=A0A5P2FX05_9BACT|nr:hypothetical protein [Rhizosphaericola mali]QES88054.1 hypothetical protein E0W69_005040 [Rhizosphaericola mali]QES88773.1 hypothetical protein E0W69_008950 [Rhizosphaericola mali]
MRKLENQSIIPIMTLIPNFSGSLFWRTMKASLFGRTETSNQPGNFKSYFQYQIGKNSTGYDLFFSKEPNAQQYYNEAFGKMAGYLPIEMSDFLSYHYQAYTNNEEFLHFLTLELAHRIRNAGSQAYRKKLEIAVDWLNTQKDTRLEVNRNAMRVSVRADLDTVLAQSEKEALSAERMEEIVGNLAIRMEDRMNSVIDSAENEIQQITSGLSTGNIQLSNREHEGLIIRFFILLQQVQAPSSNNNESIKYLFANFSKTDLAAFLRMHFEAFRSYKTSTLQKMITSQQERIKPQHEKVKQLEEAMVNFFY